MDNVFDVIVLGTGLSESIAAAALAKAGLRVAHIDPNPYYGSNEATLTLDELVQWAESHSTNAGDSEDPDPVHSCRLSVSGSPASPQTILDFALARCVSRYGSYKLLGPVAIYDDGKLQSVPQSKESIFQARTIPLIEKRRLMRFLVFASGDFETSPEFRGKEDTPFDCFLRESFGLSEEISRVIMFSLAYLRFFSRINVESIASRPQLSEIGWEIRLVPIPCWLLWGIGRKISNIVVHDVQNPERFSVELEDISDPLRSSCILSSVTCVPPSFRDRVKLISRSNVPDAGRYRLHAVARCIAIVNGTLTPPRLNEGDDAFLSEGESDSFLVIFPPGSLDGGSTTSSDDFIDCGCWYNVCTFRDKYSLSFNAFT
ncbi:GDP dissociation inhibitor-domain-containing protein [Chiua virens]|nr:GDP dissociation inhibitor-domain-containing protein [Chiua virens]